MATAYRSSASASKAHAGGTDALTITKPTGLTAGDMMIAILGIHGQQANFTLSGWTSLFATNNGSVEGLQVLWKIATAGDVAASNFAFSIGGAAGDGMAGAIVVISGASFAGVVNIQSTSDDNTAGGASSHTYTPGLTPVLTNALMLIGCYAGVNSNVSSYAITNNNPTFTEREDVAINTTRDTTIGVASATPSVASATGDYTLTTGITADTIGYMIIVTESVNANGNHPILTMASQIFTHTISVGTTATHAILSFISSIFSGHKGKIRQNNRWSSQKNTEKNWTNQKQ
jgi:hypothetical protein